ncbi:MAG: DNA-binding protein [Methylocystis sp.]|nr:MAG: DNA-binding protein [Methylocystis sp.]
MLSFEIGLVILLTLVNGALAMSELAVVSSRPARLRAMADRKVKGAAQALALSTGPGRFLSTVQIGITLVGILSGAYSGATLGEKLSAWLVGHGVPAAWAYVAGVGAIVTAITYLSLIVGELVPKQLALRNPEAVACRVAPAMVVLATIAYPIVWLLDWSGKILLAALGHKQEGERSVTEEEIKTLVAEAESAGVIEPGERKMISSVMRLGDRSVRGVMIPRVDVRMIDLSAPVADSFAAMAASPHSRFPAHDGDPEFVTGVLGVKDLLRAGGEMPDDLRPFVRAAPTIPADVDAFDAVEILRRSPVHMGMVHDEHGSFLGILTATDILEAIVGVFAEEGEIPEEAIVEREDGSLLVSGWMPVDDLAETLGLSLPETRPYQTAAGMLVDLFGKLPTVGERLSFAGWRFEIVDLDGRRIDKILAVKES